MKKAIIVAVLLLSVALFAIDPMISAEANKQRVAAEDVKNMSEFIENGDNDVNRFTITLKGDAIRNFFIYCQLPVDYEKLQKLKSYYRKLKNEL